MPQLDTNKLPDPSAPSGSNPGYSDALAGVLDRIGCRVALFRFLGNWWGTVNNTLHYEQKTNQGRQLATGIQRREAMPMWGVPVKAHYKPKQYFASTYPCTFSSYQTPAALFDQRQGTQGYTHSCAATGRTTSGVVLSTSFLDFSCHLPPLRSYLTAGAAPRAYVPSLTNSTLSHNLKLLRSKIRLRLQHLQPKLTHELSKAPKQRIQQKAGRK